MAKELLSINEALRIIVVREDVNLHALSAIPVAYCRHDWRTILITDNGFKNFSLELMGIGKWCFQRKNNINAKLPYWVVQND